MITFPQKVNNFPQIVTIHPQLVNIFSKMNFHPKICWSTRFVVNCRESHLRTFWRQIHQCAKGGGRGIKPILAMPRFWGRLLLQYIPYLKGLKEEIFEVGSYLYRLKEPTKDAGSMSSSFGLSLDKTNQFRCNPCQYNSHCNVLHVIIAHTEIVH